MKGFTGIKDVDLKILMDVDDETLLKTCSTNKELYRICNTDSFWRNRYVKQYGEKATKYKPEDRSWKNHYMQTYIDLHRFKEPMDFFSQIAWKTNVEDSFFIDNDYINKEVKIIPLRKAPEWVMNNLWLLKLGDIEISRYAHPLKIFNLHNTTPIELFKSVAGFIEEYYLHGFIKRQNVHIPLFSSLLTIRERFIPAEPWRI